MFQDSVLRNDHEDSICHSFLIEAWGKLILGESPASTVRPLVNLILIPIIGLFGQEVCM